MSTSQSDLDTLLTPPPPRVRPAGGAPMPRLVLASSAAVAAGTRPLGPQSPKNSHLDFFFDPDAGADFCSECDGDCSGRCDGSRWRRRAVLGLLAALLVGLMCAGVYLWAR